MCSITSLSPTALMRMGNDNWLPHSLLEAESGYESSLDRWVPLRSAYIPLYKFLKTSLLRVWSFTTCTYHKCALADFLVSSLYHWFLVPHQNWLKWDQLQPNLPKQTTKIKSNSVCGLPALQFIPTPTPLTWDCSLQIWNPISSLSGPREKKCTSKVASSNPGCIKKGTRCKTNTQIFYVRLLKETTFVDVKIILKNILTHLLLSSCRSSAETPPTYK